MHGFKREFVLLAEPVFNAETNFCYIIGVEHAALKFQKDEDTPVLPDEDVAVWVMALCREKDADPESPPACGWKMVHGHRCKGKSVGGWKGDITDAVCVLHLFGPTFHSIENHAELALFPMDEE
jgi:hypothetical protein